MRKYSPLLAGIMILLFSWNTGRSQEVYVSELKDIIYWLDTANQLVNNRILDIVEDKAQHLNLLIKSEDLSFSYYQPRYARITQDGKLIVNKLLEAGGYLAPPNRLHEVRDLQPLPGGNWLVSGTIVMDNRPGVYEETLNPKGEPEPYAINISFSTIYNGSYANLSNGTLVTSKTIARNNIFNMWVMVTSPDNHKVVSKQIRFNSEYSEYNIDMKIDHEDNIFVLGFRYTTPQFDKYHPVLYKADPAGTVLWSREFKAEVNCEKMQLEVDKSGNVLLVNGYGTEQTATSNSALYMVSSAGDSLNYVYLDQMRASGVLAMSNGNYMVYGSSLKAIFTTFFSTIANRAKTIVLSPDFTILNEDEMGLYDPPEFVLPAHDYIKPPSSDFIKAIELSNGRIACAGRVYMPLNTDVEKIRESEYANRSFIVFADPNGGFGNQMEKK